MLYSPHDYQQTAIDRVVGNLTRGVDELVVSPTGSGKSVIHAGCLERLPGLRVVVPQIEIATGIYKALTGMDLGEASPARQRQATEGARIYTTIRALKAAERGEAMPDYYLIDEAHHATSATLRGMSALTGGRPKNGLTATDFRGTPQGTAELKAVFGGRVWRALTEEESVRRGVTILPEFGTIPLFDDETVDVTGGEFVVKSLEPLVRSRLEALADLVALEWDASAGRFRSPTTVVLPSAAICGELGAALQARGVPFDTVLAATKKRGTIFARVVRCETVLLQMRVVGEGVDLPLRCMIDAAPTMSPLLWMQRVGRIRRPYGGICGSCGEVNRRPFRLSPMPVQVCLNKDCGKADVHQEPPSRYLSCCHNILRHGHLFAGLMPPSVLREARTVWGEDFKPSRRMMGRALGLSGFGRFEPAVVPMSDGQEVWMYMLKAGLTSYAALMIPGRTEAVYAMREDVKTGRRASFEKSPAVYEGIRDDEGRQLFNPATGEDIRLLVKPAVVIEYDEKKKGPWEQVRELPEIQGAVSYPKEAVGPGMKSWWKDAAAHFRLDPDFVPTAKEAQILPILKDTRVRL
jgi:superfamily II DNA or RNA helicase